MISPADLLAGLQRLLKRLESDIRTRFKSTLEIDAQLRAEYDKARSAFRTAQAFDIWREDYITQVAVAWILGCVFVRFLEDNRLIETAWLAGPSDRLQLARDQQTIYFQANPSHSYREYLEYVFHEVAKLPSMRELLAGSHNPVSKFGPTGDGARELLDFWQSIAPENGELIHDFTDSEWDTRFLGDIYQELSKSARKKFALLQTPDFVEEFILDRTLDPAIREFGYSKVRMIDPACGSGHFLLGGFERLYRLWAQNEPGTNHYRLAQLALDGIYGVDLNPYAVAIARFRLLVAALRVCECRRLANAPAFSIHVATGDSLFHGPRLGSELERVKYLEGMDPLQHVYDIEDEEQLRQILGQQYHAVVGNPPYIVVRDKSLNSEYRKRFGSCHRQYSLAVPFMERFFNLAIDNVGFVGMITANSFMKREFGKKLIENYILNWDLTHVIDTSRAHIPKHGTPTVILFGRNRKPVSGVIRAVLGIRGEAKTPTVPAQGLVWRAIVNQVDTSGSESPFVSAADMPRNAFEKHPWSIGGGGAIELKEAIESGCNALVNEIDTICLMCKTREDEAYLMPVAALKRNRIQPHHRIPSVQGDQVRDWLIGSSRWALFPYDRALSPVSSADGPDVHRFLWPYKELLWRRKELGGDHRQLGRTWWEYNRFLKHRFVVPYSIAFAFVATHNHFVLDRGGKIFNGSAPVVKLQKNATEQDHLSLVALLNSSTACFWMKQSFHNKGGGGIGGGLATEEWEQFYEFDATKLRNFPLPEERPTQLGALLELSARECAELQSCNFAGQELPADSWLDQAENRLEQLRMRMVSLQEELDWQCYKLYGLLDRDLYLSGDQAPLIRPGERAFEIALARSIEDGEAETTWFERHGAKPTTELPPNWPAGYRNLVEERIAVIEEDRSIAMIEQPEYKRRWNTVDWQDVRESAIRESLLCRIEESGFWANIELTSCAKLADYLQNDYTFCSVARLFRRRPDFDMLALIEELVQNESVPCLPCFRYTETGLRKRSVWEQTWNLQRLNDANEVPVPQSLAKPSISGGQNMREQWEISPPPRYELRDFQKQSYWLLSGKLEVPKQRFISFPLCERDVDQTLVMGWAGWDHLQQAQAIAAYYERVKNQEGWTPERRVPLLTAILELLPWLKQWHNDIHPEYQERMGDFFEHFVADEARAMEMTVEQIRDWTPPARSTGRGRKKRNT